VCQERYKRERTVDGASESHVASQQERSQRADGEEDFVAKEAQDSAEGRIPDCPTTAGPVLLGRPASRVTTTTMQAAKKLVLVDEFDRAYKRLQRPADVVAKTGKSLQLSRTLDDTTLADDRKVREYVTALHRYLNTRKELPSEASATVNPPPIQPAFADEQPPRQQQQQQQQLQQLPQQEVQQKKKKKKKGRNKKQQRLAWDQRGSGSKRPPPFWEKY